MIHEFGDHRRFAIERDEYAVAREAPVGDGLEAKRACPAEGRRELPIAAVQEEERKEEPYRVERRKRRDEGERDEGRAERLVPPDPGRPFAA